MQQREEERACLTGGGAAVEQDGSAGGGSEEPEEVGRLRAAAWQRCEERVEGFALVWPAAARSWRLCVDLSLDLKGRPANQEQRRWRGVIGWDIAAGADAGGM